MNKRKEVERIDYDYLVICTGAGYSHPIKESYEETIKLNQRTQRLENTRKEIKEAQSILVVGGGPNGVEAMGNLVYGYSD